VEVNKIEEIINLYHGGPRDQIGHFQAWGLDETRPLYCTRHLNLAREAANPEGKVFYFPIPRAVFQEYISEGYFEEKPYLGSIQVEWCNEVIVHPGASITLLNTILDSERTY